jgi:aromatic ring-opening dioxygenase catalytic subunit (LigB family)
MGEIVAAALVSHDPTIMLDEEARRAGNGGRDTSLVAGFAEIRKQLNALGADTLIIFDTHWVTTAEHIVAGRDHYRGIYTSDGSDHDYFGLRIRLCWRATTSGGD